MTREMVIKFFLGLKCGYHQHRSRGWRTGCIGDEKLEHEEQDGLDNQKGKHSCSLLRLCNIVLCLFSDLRGLRYRL